MNRAVGGKTKTWNSKLKTKKEKNMSMKKMRKATMAAMILLGCVCAPVAATVSYAQLTDAAGNKVESDTSKQTTKSSGGFYDIVFEDNGPGVSDENRSRLFTPNFTTKSNGTGLGLSICRNIVEKCNGEIFYSKSFTLKGACFTVRYPRG